jgi:hypothetical protein
VHPKRKITERNKWLVDNADLVIAFVEDGKTGGALATLNYAIHSTIERGNDASMSFQHSKRLSQLP